MQGDLEGVKVTAEMRQAAEWMAQAARATFLIPPVSGEGNPAAEKGCRLCHPSRGHRASWQTWFGALATSGAE